MHHHHARAGGPTGWRRWLRAAVLLAGACTTRDRQPSGPGTVSQVFITPHRITIAAGATQQFDAYGRSTAGDSIAVAIDFIATGGAITPGGLFTAGSVAGEFSVMAMERGGTLADTAGVTITVPGPPILAAVILQPASVSLAQGATQQFAVYGRMSNGDSVAVAVTFAVTGGTITPAGLYTAGQTTGTYSVIATDTGGAYADTASVMITAVPVGAVVFVGAGDISECGDDNDEATATLLDGIAGTVYTLGDNVYSSGTAAQFSQCYDPTWGRHKARTRPAPGNHDYNTSGASGYFGYFGELAGPSGRGYYS
ncbi:MAG TPA: hypothetical protein VIV10_04255, partial [Gemmatimonadales bacterium]